MGGRHSFTLTEEVVDGRLPLTTLRQPNPSKHSTHGALIIYGGSTKPEFRYEVLPFANILASEGITVFVFDFEGNVPGDDFFDFGIWHRTQDASTVLRYIQAEYPELELTIVGVSMGGEIATTIASRADKEVPNLVLVAPAAYTPAAIRPDVTFGPETKRLISRPDSWQLSRAFTDAMDFTGRTLVIAYGEDEGVSPAITNQYHTMFRIKLERTPRRADGWNTLVTLRGFGHKGTFDNPEKRALVAGKIAQFVLQTSPANAEEARLSL